MCKFRAAYPPSEARSGVAGVRRFLDIERIYHYVIRSSLLTPLQKPLLGTMSQIAKRRVNRPSGRHRDVFVTLQKNFDFKNQKSQTKGSQGSHLHKMGLFAVESLLLLLVSKYVHLSILFFHIPALEYPISHRQKENQNTPSGLCTNCWRIFYMKEGRYTYYPKEQIYYYCAYSNKTWQIQYSLSLQVINVDDNRRYYDCK